MLQEKKKHRRKKSKPSAMAQVHNRVNAGVMDGVVYGGGMMEAAEPEADEYKLAMEPGGPSKTLVSVMQPCMYEQNMELLTGPSFLSIGNQREQVQL